MPGLGTDIAGVEDIDLFLSTADPSLAAAQAVMRSLLHAPGLLWWAPDAGHDVKQYLHGFFDAERMRRGIQAACEREERVATAKVTANIFGTEIKLSINLTFIDGSTPATLTLTIDQLGKVLDASITV
jgi:hypothetical protein